MGIKTEIQIAVVEDSSAFRRRLIDALNAHVGWRVVVACGNVPDALRKIPRAKPDLVLLDLRLPHGSGLDLIDPLRNELPGVPIVMLTVVDDPAKIDRAIRAGAYGYIIKTEAEELIGSVEDALAGRAPAMSPAVARYLWERAGRPLVNLSANGFDLTPREHEVLRLAMRGKQNREIADDLEISINTLKHHFGSIYRKLGAQSRVDALVKLNSGRGMLDESAQRGAGKRFVPDSLGRRLGRRLRATVKPRNCGHGPLGPLTSPSTQCYLRAS